MTGIAADRRATFAVTIDVAAKESSVAPQGVVTLEAGRPFSRLIADLAHPLRTPLHAIVGVSDLLVSGAVSPQTSKHQQFLAHIGTAGRQLLQLVSDIIDLSKIEAGTLELFPERIDLPELLAEVLRSLPCALLNDAEIQSVIDPELSSIWADPVRLKQVLGCYLKAAIRAVSRGGTVAIRVAANEGSGIRLEIAQTLVSTVKGVQSAEAVAILEQGTPEFLTRELCRKLIEAQGGTTRVQDLAEGHWKVEIMFDSPKRVDQNDADSE